MNRSKLFSLVALGVWMVHLPSCSNGQSSATGTETNWLQQCDSDSDCGPYACYCGACSASCITNDECAHEAVAGECKPSESNPACSSETPKRVCVPADPLGPTPTGAADAGSAVASTSRDSGSSSDLPTASEPNVTVAPSSTSENDETFAYATIACERRAPSQCYQGDGCYAVFASEADGNERVIGCTESPDGSGPVCSTSPAGEALLVYLDPPPPGWTTTSASECELDCFSPWRNAERANESDLPGCPCTTTGSVCTEGVGMECFDATDDLQDDRVWQVTSRPCDETTECVGGARLTDCLAGFETCVVGGVVLDKGDFIYCGAVPLPCSLRSEIGCKDECEPLYGTTRDGRQAFGGCLDAGVIATCGGAAETLCVQQSTPQTAVPVRDTEPVSIEACAVPEGFALHDSSSCEAPPLSSSCAERSEATCTEPCSPYVGRRSPGGSGEFIACGDVACSASRTICAEGPDGSHVEFFGCMAPGWTEVNTEECNGDAGP